MYLIVKSTRVKGVKEGERPKQISVWFDLIDFFKN